MKVEQRMGISGRIAAAFQNAQITPLLAMMALLLGIFAVMVTPREEEPQINVTMANVLIPFPGAAVADVEQMVAGPGEQVLAQIAGVEHVMSVSNPGLAVLTVQFKVGVPRIEALVRLHDTLRDNTDWLPKGLGVMDPIIKPKGIDDVPIVALTLYSKDPATGAFELERVAHSMEAELKRVSGTREVRTLGGPGRAVLVQIDPGRMAGSGVTVQDLRQALQSANLGMPVGDLVAGNRSVAIEAGPYLAQASDVADLVVGVRDGKPVFLKDVAEVRDGPPPASRYAWYGQSGKNGGAEYPAVTLTVTKKPGENAIDVANGVARRVEQLRNTVIPAGVEVAVTRDYGATANDKAIKLIQKLLFATTAVVALVFIALGRREAAIVGAAVILTLTATLFASWAWGFTLNRVSLFALIFSIGILVDDAIVVVENIHRHQQLYPDRTLAQIIPGAVDEVGGPTILATFTVIAALLPMAFVSGLMGPYMSPIPINASMGMLLSLAIAFMITPWLARLWMKHTPAHGHATGAATGMAAKLTPLFERVFKPLLDDRRGQRNRRLLGLGIAALIALSLVLPATGLVLLKMLPFDNKSEFQVVVDMPAGTPVEQTAAVLHELGAHLSTVPEVTDYQAYAGTSAQAWCASTTCAPAARSGTSRSTWSTSTPATSRATPSRPGCGRSCSRSASASAPTSRWSKCRRARRCSRRSWRKSTAPMPRGGARSPRPCGPCSRRPRTWWTSTTPASRTRRASCCWWTGARPPCSACRSRPSSARCAPAWPAKPRLTCTMPASTRRRPCCSCSRPATATSTRCCNCRYAAPRASWCRSANW